MAAALQPSHNGRLHVDAPTDEQAKQCARILLKQHGSAIKLIDLRRGSITSIGAGFLAKALKGNSSLRHLGLQGNVEVGDVGAKAIGVALEANHQGCALMYLDLSSTGITVVGLKDLAQGAGRLSNLHTLCVSDNNLAQEAGHQLSTLFRTSKSLHTLLAAGNYLGDRGLAALCGALCHIRPVRVVSLDVSSNGVGDLGMRWLTRGISALCRQKDSGIHHGGGSGEKTSSWPSGGIRDIRLRGNNITHAGAKELATLLSEDRCAHELRELDLSLNTITNEGFHPLVASLKGCRELIRLDVAGCRLGPGGVKTIARLLVDAPPLLSKINLAPKTEFADRVLSDREGLAVALCEALQQVADALPFAGAVVELGLGFYSRADPAASDVIERTLLEHRERMGVASTEGTAGAGARPEAGVAAHKGGGDIGISDREGRTPVSNEKKTRVPSKSGSSSGGSSNSRTRVNEDSGSASISGRRGETPRPTQRGTSGRSRDRQGTPRAFGIERPKAGLERAKAGLERSKASTAERMRRNAGNHSSGTVAASVNATPPSGSGSLSRSSSSTKSSIRGKSSAGRSQKTTPATLAARDREATAAVELASANSGAQPQHRRMHQGEELDSIDGFTPVPSNAMATANGLPMSATSSKRYLTYGGGGGAGGAGSRKMPNHFDDGRNAGDPFATAATKSTTTAGAAARSSSRTLPRMGSAGQGSNLSAVAGVVSDVIADTAAMDDLTVSPPPVAPSTWQDGSNGASDHSTSMPLEGMPPRPPAFKMRPPEPHSAGSTRDGHSPKLLRKTTSVSSVKGNDEPEIVEGVNALTLMTDEPASRARSNSGETRICSQETAIELSTPSGAGAQQMISLEEAGQLLGPIVAKEVAKETRRLEIKFQNNLNTALTKVRAELQSIDREGLVARVALEKRVTSGVRRLLEKLEKLERRFARMEKEDRERKRLALEASGGSGETTEANSTHALTAVGATPPRRKAAAPVILPPPPGPVGLGLGSAAADGFWARGEAHEVEELAVGEGDTARSRRGGGGGAAADVATRDGGASVVPESARPAVEPAAGRRALASGADGGGSSEGEGGVESGAATSEETLMDSCDEEEADMVRRLEAKMAALEGKLIGHEERQRNDYRVAVEDETF